MKIKEIKKQTRHQALRPIGHNYNTVEDSNQSNSVRVLQETPTPEIYSRQHQNIETPQEGLKSETNNIHNLLGKKAKNLELTEENIKKHNKKFEKSRDEDDIDFDQYSGI